jgi:hypothetical protein
MLTYTIDPARLCAVAKATVHYAIFPDGRVIAERSTTLMGQ